MEHFNATLNTLADIIRTVAPLVPLWLAYKRQNERKGKPKSGKL